MATANMGHEEVKRILDKLECSPSSNDDSTPFRGHPNVTPGGRSANARKYRLATPESEMSSFNYNRGGRIAGYKEKFAGPARQGT